MKYLRPAFTVPAGGNRDPETCTHEWQDLKRQRCVLCGTPITYERFHIPDPEPPKAA